MKGLLARCGVWWFRVRGGVVIRVGRLEVLVRRHRVVRSDAAGRVAVVTAAFLAGLGRSL